jgi:hypothetical protein
MGATIYIRRNKMPMQPKKNVRGPVGFGKITVKREAKQAAAEWVNNTSSGNNKSDAKIFDALMKKAGFPNTKNPFVKPKPKIK